VLSVKVLSCKDEKKSQVPGRLSILRIQLFTNRHI